MREQAGCVVASGSKKSKHCSTKSFTIAKKSYKIEPYYETTGDTEENLWLECWSTGVMSNRLHVKGCKLRLHKDGRCEICAMRQRLFSPTSQITYLISLFVF
jgi:hypothetical protein